jgi:hypothetical protein
MFVEFIKNWVPRPGSIHAQQTSNVFESHYTELVAADSKRLEDWAWTRTSKEQSLNIY